MMTQLTWSALILAALAAVACWNAEDEGACNEIRPVFGSKVCCQKHKAAVTNSAAAVALREETWRPVVSRPARR
jgi:hypothetical protein